MLVPRIRTCLISFSLLLLMGLTWEILRLNFTPGCPTGSPHEKCYRSVLANNPELQLALFTSKSAFPDGTDVTQILHVPDFDYNSIYFKETTVKIEDNETLYVHVVLASMDNEHALKHFNWLRQTSLDHLITVYTSQLTGLSPQRVAAYDLIIRGQANKPKIQLGGLVPHYVSKIYMVGLTGNIYLSFIEISRELRDLFLVNYGSDMQFLPIIAKDMSKINTDDLFEITENTREVKFEFHWEPIELGPLRMLLRPKIPNIFELSKLFVFYGSKNFEFYVVSLWLTNVYLFTELLNIFLSRKAQKAEGKAALGATLFDAIKFIILCLYFLDVPIYAFAVYYGCCLIEPIFHLWERKAQRMIQSSKEYEVKRTKMKTTEFLIYFLIISLYLSAAADSLLHETHEDGWYSWSLQFLANFFYVFELAASLCNLYVNYKLKTVEAQPWHKVVPNSFRRIINVIFAVRLQAPKTFTLFCICDNFITVFDVLQRCFYGLDECRHTSYTKVNDGFTHLE